MIVAQMHKKVSLCGNNKNIKKVLNKHIYYYLPIDEFQTCYNLLMNAIKYLNKEEKK
jgi:hypothetical protein